MKFDDIKNIAVIGSGAMGNGIAQVCAVAGFKTTMVDIKQEFIDNGFATIGKSLDFLVRKEKISAADKEDILTNRLGVSLDIGQAVAEAQVIIEAVPEIMALKKEVFGAVAEAAPEDAILASNTSTMSITEIATAAKNPERFIGMHFFNPVPAMRLVEVIYGRQTTEDTMDLVCELVNKIKKIPVKVLKDSPGFIVNRIGAPNQALVNAILDEGKMKPDEIDAVMRQTGMTIAPFELADFVGMDVFYHTLKYYSETLSPDFAPSQAVKEMIDNGDLGMKTGQGIYTWDDGKAQIDLTQYSTEITPMEFLSIQINEAVRVYKENLAESIDDIDLAMVHGMRAIAGPFQLSSGLEPQQITDTLSKLHERFGLDIYKPEPEIVDGSFKSLGK